MQNVNLLPSVVQCRNKHCQHSSGVGKLCLKCNALNISSDFNIWGQSGTEYTQGKVIRYMDLTPLTIIASEHGIIFHPFQHVTAWYFNAMKSKRWERVIVELHILLPCLHLCSSCIFMLRDWKWQLKHLTLNIAMWPKNIWPFLFLMIALWLVDKLKSSPEMRLRVYLTIRPPKTMTQFSVWQHWLKDGFRQKCLRLNQNIWHCHC